MSEDALQDVQEPMTFEAYASEVLGKGGMSMLLTCIDYRYPRRVLDAMARLLPTVAYDQFILAGASLIVARHSINMNEGLSGLFFLLSGAVFPLEVLPRWAQTLSLGLPFTYWLELLRRLILGRPYAAPLAPMSDVALWGILALSTAMLTVAALLWFAWCEHVARSRGLIDWKTNY